MKVDFRHFLPRLLCRTVAAAFLLAAGSPAFAQSSVWGRVTAQDGTPVAGAAVVVAGTGNGTMTDADGYYSIAVSRGKVLEFQCLGMVTVRRVYDGTFSMLNVTLEEDTDFLDEVVVVGYGSQKKSSLTSAVSAIRGEDLMKAPSTNVSQLLAGRLTGVSSVQESGEPGQDYAALRIRGSKYEMAYVVDGFPAGNINDIDPNDVESVSVLKDGASAAVYGLKAAGGVLIITTKKGESGKPKISYNGSVGASMNANFPKFMDGPQYAYYYNMAQMMDQLASGIISSREEYVPYYSDEVIAAMTNGDPSDGWDNVDYIKKIFGTGFTQKHGLTVTGGGEQSKYFVSAGYLGQKGNIKGYNYRRYSLRANIESRIAGQLTFAAGLNGVAGRREAPRFVSGGTDSDPSQGEVGWFSLGHQAISMHPYLPETWEGYYTGYQTFNQEFPDSPLAALNQSGYRHVRSFEGTANVSLQWDLPWVKGLYLKAGGSYSYSSSYSKNLSTPYRVMQHLKADDGSWYWNLGYDPTVNEKGVISLGEGSVYSEQLVGQLSAGYVAGFGEHHLDLLALVEVRDAKSNDFAAYAKNLAFAELPELSFGIPASSPVSGMSYASRTAGYVFRARYDYAEKYLAEFTGRYDGSYKFAGMTSTRWGFFPSLSLGWRISKEDFMQDIDAISDFKLRGSVGLLGNDSVSEYMFLSQYSTSGGKVIYPLPGGGQTVGSTYYASVPNNGLTWEKTRSWNFGFDLSLWEGKLGAEADAFYNYTYDVLTANGGGYPDSMGGYYPAYINYDALGSRGIDLMLSHKNSFLLLGKPFFYGITGTLTYAKTKWLRHQDDPNAPEWQKLVGTTYGALMGVLADGLYRSEEEIDEGAWYSNRPNLGDIKYVDMNGDGKIDTAQDMGYFGRSNRPELTFGLNLNFQWNGFDFNAQFTGGALFDVSLTGRYAVIGENGSVSMVQDHTVWTQTFKEGSNSPLWLVENSYSIDNPDGSYPRITLHRTSRGGHNDLTSSFWWRDGKYVRLKSAQIGYTVPAKLTEHIGVQNLRIYVEGQNLFTLSGLPKGIDPESPGVNNGYYPQQRTVMGGVSLTF